MQTLAAAFFLVLAASSTHAATPVDTEQVNAPSASLKCPPGQVALRATRLSPTGGATRVEFVDPKTKKKDFTNMSNDDVRRIKLAPGKHFCVMDEEPGMGGWK